MQTRKLGKSNLEVSAIGLGCMSMSVNYGPPKDKKEMIALMRSAVDRSVTFFDTAQLTADDLREIETAAAKITVHGPRGTGREQYM